MSDTTLRQALTKLAHEKPELRKHLVPILASSQELKCDNMTNKPTCDGKVTHIDRKGFIYCTPCGEKRQGARKMTKAEIQKLEEGKTISYGKQAMEFPTEEALKTYLKEHPDADRSKHKVVEKSDGPKQPDAKAEHVKPNKTLGDLLSQWHSSMNDPIYAVSSNMSSGHPVPRATVEKALESVSKSLQQAQFGAHGWGPTEVKELTKAKGMMEKMLKGTGKTATVKIEQDRQSIVLTDTEFEQYNRNTKASALDGKNGSKMTAAIRKVLSENAQEIERASDVYRAMAIIEAKIRAMGFKKAPQWHTWTSGYD